MKSCRALGPVRGWPGGKSLEDVCAGAYGAGLRGCHFDEEGGLEGPTYGLGGIG